MQGTWHVRSLIRLFIGAALLCLAWVVLTSGQASAAERPAPAKPLSDLGRSLPLGVDTQALETVLGTVLGAESGSDARPAAGTARPAKAQSATAPSAPVAKARSTKSPAKSSAGTPAAEMASAATLSATDSSLIVAVGEVERHVAPVVEAVEAGTRSTVDAGLLLASDVTDVAAVVPVVGTPVAQVSEAVVALVRDLPVLGVPSPIVPLPIGDETPTEAVPPLPGVEVVATEQPSVPALDDTSLPSVRASLGSLGLLSAACHTDTSPATAALRATSRSHGEPAGPWSPREPTPVLPTPPSPTGGTVQGAGDPAVATAQVILSNLRMFGRSNADWRVPRGLPAQPGTRPD